MKKNLFYGRVSTQFSPYTLPFIKYTVTLFFFFSKGLYTHLTKLHWFSIKDWTLLKKPGLSKNDAKLV